MTNKQTRTRTGCLCCRRRHKKCDERKPSCQFCVSKGLLCEWPIKGSVFVNYQKKDKSVISTTPSSPGQSIYKQYQPLFQVSPSTSNIPTTTSATGSAKSRQPSIPNIKASISIPSPPSSESSVTSALDSSYDEQKFLNYSFTPVRSASIQEPLPSLKQYHFIIPRDRSASLDLPVPENNNEQSKRLSVSSLLN